MSRTEGFTLPRIPAAHSRLAVPSKTWASHRPHHYRSLSEPTYYTSYLCCPRQDVPNAVIRDPPACDEVFDKIGRDRVLPRIAAKVDTPLTTSEYDSLHDPHVRHLYLRNKSLRQHLIRNGLVTEELRVLGRPEEYRQHVRAHEILERKEQLQRKLEEREVNRLSKIGIKHPRLPKLVLKEMERAETRQAHTQHRQTRQAEERNQQLQDKHEERRMQEAAKKQARLARQREEEMEEEQRREERRQQEEEMFMTKYNNRFAELPNGSEIAAWHREADVLEHRIQVMEYLHWGADGQRGMEGNSLLAYLNTIDWDQRVKEASSQPRRRIEEAKIAKEFADAEAERTAVRQDLDNVKVELQTELDALSREERGSHQLSQEEDTQQREQRGDEGMQAVVSDVDLFQDLLTSNFKTVDDDNNGYLPLDSFVSVLNSRAVDLQLNDEEMHYILSHASHTDDGYVSYTDVVPIMSNILREIYKERAETGQDTELGLWKMLYSPTRGYVYFHKETGDVQRTRPADYVPPLRDELFWETMLDIFTTADSNQDGLLDRHELYLLLMSKTVGLRLSEEQRGQVLDLFDSMGAAAVAFEDFIPLARIIIMMVYQRQYDGSAQWIELNSAEYGPFWYDRHTGEVLLNPPASVSSEEVTATEPVSDEHGILPIAPQEPSHSAPSSVSRSLGGVLPPIAEVTDRDTLGGSPESAAAIKRSSSLDIERPQSPLPPADTPEVDNRPESPLYRDVSEARGTIGASHESERSQGKRRHRTRRSRSRLERSFSREERSKEAKSRGHSRRRRRHLERAAVSDINNVDVEHLAEQFQGESKMVKTTVIPDESVEAHQKTETMNNNVAEAADKSDAVEPENFAPVSELQEKTTEVAAVSPIVQEERDVYSKESQLDDSEEANVILDKADLQEHEGSNQHLAQDKYVTQQSDQYEQGKIEEDTSERIEGEESLEAEVVSTKNEPVDADANLEEPTVEQEMHLNSVTDIEPHNQVGEDTLSTIKSAGSEEHESSALEDDNPTHKPILEDQIENQVDIMSKSVSDSTLLLTDKEANDLDMVTDNTEPMAIKDRNLPDDDKISLGTRSLPKISKSKFNGPSSRAGSASTGKATIGQISPTSSFFQSHEGLVKDSPTASESRMKSQSQASGIKTNVDDNNYSIPTDHQSITDQEKLASRRSSLIEAQ